ncbi:MAG: L-seryl-tRNA(Sec) selenium transferase [Pirellulaceae bacterium]|jgi:L-seryl-tRNA(Ser) seleniumtransferase|nr:L-seryl-tRNA(Sec) selenium transferase [Planctomycetaceae bacterium]MDP6556413.1 L-seryl-tRNA(Sec) selenium transferase [Pirellulaceae bacterium]
MQNPLRNIPSVNELLEIPPLCGMVDRVSHSVVVSGVRTFLSDFRDEVQTAASEFKVPTATELAERIAEWIVKDETPSLRPVINATGILLHTGLGRAPLAGEAIQAMSEVAAGYSSVEVDLATGERSQRVLAVESLLTKLTGAEAAVVTNNNAAATLLTLTTLAAGREVIVSRGQLIEIGGSFRLPDVMTASGARLREVGTTNKTRLADYEQAIGEETAALMNVHTSNYRVVGFTEEVTTTELVKLGRDHKLPVIDDIGSGALLDLTKYGINEEPIAPESIKAGADAVLFSGDKLLGGPQCGIIVGRRSVIDQIAEHPMMRAMRVDKLTLAALAATLRLYRDPETVELSLPFLSLISTPIENLRSRAERLAPQLAALDTVATADPMDDVTYLGGGSVPTQQIKTCCVAVTPAVGSVSDFATRLRNGCPAVFGRIFQDRFLFDLRTVFPHQDAMLITATETGPNEANLKNTDD